MKLHDSQQVKNLDRKNAPVVRLQQQQQQKKN